MKLNVKEFGIVCSAPAKKEIVQTPYSFLASSMVELKSLESLIFMKYLATIPYNAKTVEDRTVVFSLQDFRDLLGANVSSRQITEYLNHLCEKKVKVPTRVSYRTKEGRKILEDECEMIFYVPLLVRGESKDKQLFALRIAEELVPLIDKQLQRSASTSIEDIQRMKASPKEQALHRFLLLHHFGAAIRHPGTPGGEIEVYISDLQEILGMTGDKYNEFRYFNRELKAISAAVNEKTYVKHSYRKGNMIPGTHKLETLFFRYECNPLVAGPTE